MRNTCCFEGIRVIPKVAGAPFQQGAITIFTIQIGLVERFSLFVTASYLCDYLVSVRIVSLIEAMRETLNLRCLQRLQVLSEMLFTHDFERRIVHPHLILP